MIPINASCSRSSKVSDDSGYLAEYFLAYFIPSGIMCVTSSSIAFLPCAITASSTASGLRLYHSSFFRRRLYVITEKASFFSSSASSGFKPFSAIHCLSISSIFVIHLSFTFLCFICWSGFRQQKQTGHQFLLSFCFPAYYFFSYGFAVLCSINPMR